MSSNETRAQGTSAPPPTRPTYPSLRVYLKATGTTQRDLADALDLHQSYVSLLVRRLRTPRLDIALKISDYTGVPVDALSPKRRKKKLAATLTTTATTTEGPADVHTDDDTLYSDDYAGPALAHR